MQHYHHAPSVSVCSPPPHLLARPLTFVCRVHVRFLLFTTVIADTITWASWTNSRCICRVKRGSGWKPRRMALPSQYKLSSHLVKSRCHLSAAPPRLSTSQDLSPAESPFPSVLLRGNNMLSAGHTAVCSAVPLVVARITCRARKLCTPKTQFLYASFIF